MLMEVKMKTMGEEMVDLRLREASMMKQLQMENKRLREKLQEKEVKITTIESVDMEATQCKHP